MFGGLAQMERELIAERSRNALACERDQRQPTSHLPLGAGPNGKRERMVPAPEELDVVRETPLPNSGTKIAAKIRFGPAAGKNSPTLAAAGE